MDYKNLINWKELSLLLAGNEGSIRKNKIPQKYQREVNELIEAIRKHLKK